MKKMYLLLVVITFFASKSFGQCSECSKSLDKDYILNKSNVYQVINYFEKISDEQFYSLKRDADVSAKYFFIGGSANYSEFQENLKKYEQQVNYSSNYGANSEYLSYTTNPIVYRYWGECMRACLSTPFTAWIDNENENNVTVGMKFNYLGTGSTTLRVQIEINQNGTKTTVYDTINAGGEIPYIIDRNFDNDGKSLITVKVQPVDDANKPIYNGYTYNSKYFNPVLLINGVYLEYSDIERKIVYATGELHADEFEEHKCSGLYEDYCDASPATRSCDGKYAARPCLAEFRADNGYYFADPGNINYVSFVPSGEGAIWNNNNFCKDRNTDIRQKTSNFIQILFMGSASKATNWTVSREEFKNIRPALPLLFYYASKSVVNFSVPLDKMNEFTISIRTPNNGTFTIDKNNIARFQNADAGGYKNFTVDLNKLKDPSLFMELNNMKEFQQLNQQKIQNLYKKN